ncbi:DUF2970 domain-containing protein [Paraburkholderia diazotrophica]|uniref:Glycerol kinase n=1 Tax=Paraburkholderia diazotrophica TaxID=667676 RepID=A0A1H6XVP3_9BURK|nr:DUF2970 domain-containing protein [Paraburkholderia diazotrophica]SEJ33109.1 Protein of unknown function [Paraburkholderia diazotrophica]
MEILKLIRIVLWSFFGVRKSASHDADFANVNIVLLPFVAVVLAACIGGTIFAVVHLVAHATHTLQGF